MTNLRLAVLISGAGSTLQNLIQGQAAGRLPVDFRLVVSSSRLAGGLQYAHEASIPVEVVSRRDFPHAQAHSDRLFALWPYSRWDDPRFRPGEEAIEIVTQPIARPFKLGYLNHAGWLAYRYGGVTFTKRWTPRPAQRHVDFGCNAEVYTNDRHLELETLGPLVRLSPGESVEHVEAWELGATDSN